MQTEIYTFKNIFHHPFSRSGRETSVENKRFALDPHTLTTTRGSAEDGEDYRAEGGLRRNRRGWAAVKVCLCDTRGDVLLLLPPSILSLALRAAPALNPPHASQT